MDVNVNVDGCEYVDYLMIGATTRIGREILCLPCAEFWVLIKVSTV